MRAPSPLLASSTVSLASLRAACLPSLPLSSLVEGIRKSIEGRAVGLIATRCAAIGPPCRRIACFRSTWPRLPRLVQRPWPTTEATLARQMATRVQKRKTTNFSLIISANQRLQRSDKEGLIKHRSLGASEVAPLLPSMLRRKNAVEPMTSRHTGTTSIEVVTNSLAGRLAANLQACRPTQRHLSKRARQG